jgi:hypothetical protein
MVEPEFIELWNASLGVYSDYTGIYASCLFIQGLLSELFDSRSERISRVVALLKEVKQFEIGGLVTLQDMSCTASLSQFISKLNALVSWIKLLLKTSSH